MCECMGQDLHVTVEAEMCVCLCVSRLQVGKENDGCVGVCICVEGEMLFVSVGGVCMSMERLVVC